MEIIIDTNIIFNDWALRTEDSEAFLDFVDRTASIIYVPRIVWEETRKNYRNDIIKKHEAYEKASKQFGKILVIQPELKIVRLNYDEESTAYLQWLSEKLRFEGLKNVLPYGEFTERIANRVMAKRKPFNLQNNNEYKDTLVWETVLDVVTGARGRGDEEVVLISNDINAFGAGALQQGKQQVRNQKSDKQTGVLHPHLQEDIDSALETGEACNFYYYESFAEFLSAHYTHIKGIDSESIRAFFEHEESGFEENLRQELRNKRADLINALQSINSTSSVSIDIDQLKIDKVSPIQDFYVYPTQKGEKVIASGKIFVYLEGPVQYSYATYRISTPAIINPVAEIKFYLPYINGKPTKVNFESLDIPIGSGLRLPERPISRTEEILRSSPALETLRSYFETSVSQPFSTKMDNYLWEIDDLDKYRWGEQRERKSFPKELTSNYIPQRRSSVPVPKGIPSKRKKKGAKKR